MIGPLQEETIKCCTDFLRALRIKKYQDSQNLCHEFWMILSLPHMQGREPTVLILYPSKLGIDKDLSHVRRNERKVQLVGSTGIQSWNTDHGQYPRYCSMSYLQNGQQGTSSRTWPLARSSLKPVPRKFWPMGGATGRPVGWNFLRRYFALDSVHSVFFYSKYSMIKSPFAFGFLLAFQYSQCHLLQDIICYETK